MFDRTLNPGQLEIVREIVDGNATGDIDIAVYRDVVDELRLHAATRTVASRSSMDRSTNETDADDRAKATPLSDGTDRLFNIEKLRFSDGDGGTVDYDIDDLFKPCAGAPVISDMTPTEGQRLTVDASGIQDATAWDVPATSGSHPPMERPGPISPERPRDLHA